MSNAYAYHLGPDRDRSMGCFRNSVQESRFHARRCEGLKNQWFARDQDDPDAGYSITLWDTEADMRAFWDSKKREEAMALLRPYFLNQFTVTHCEVRYSRHE